MASVLTGRVKWFSNPRGFGFITVSDKASEHCGKDIFAHHSKIKVEEPQYKYLVQGEYVQFELDTTANGAHEFQANEITGCNGGKLMCETRRDNRSRATEETVGAEVAGGAGVPPPKRILRRPPVAKDAVQSSDEPGFTQVSKKRQSRTKK